MFNTLSHYWRKICPKSLDQEMLHPGTQSFKCDERVLNPYDMARSEWDARIGSAVISARNWRYASFGLMALSLLWVAIIYKQSNKPPIKPILVEVEQVTGRVARVENLNSLEFNPSEALKRHFLFEWVKNFRNLPLDIVLLNNQLEKLYYFVTDNGKAKLTDTIRANHPYLRFKEGETAEIELVAMNAMNTESYLIQWNEKTFHSGRCIKQELWQAVLTIAQSAPEDERTLMVNPVGLWIDNFSITKVEKFEGQS